MPIPRQPAADSRSASVSSVSDRRDGLVTRYTINVERIAPDADALPCGWLVRLDNGFVPKLIKPVVYSLLHLYTAFIVSWIEDLKARIRARHYFLEQQSLLNLAFFYSAFPSRTDHGNACPSFDEVTDALNYGFFRSNDAEVNPILICLCKFADGFYVQIWDDNVLCRSLQVERITLFVGNV